MSKCQTKVGLAGASGLALGFAIAWGIVAGSPVWGQARGTRTVTFPYSQTDAAGNQWQIYGNGMAQQQGGNAPVFAQLAQLSVNGANINMRGNQSGKVDEKTGELLLENLSVGGVSVTRRILLDPADGSIRYLDTFKTSANAANKAVTLNLNYSSNFNFGIMQARTVLDSRKKDKPLGWAGMTHGNRAVHLTWAASGSKIAPRINWPEGSNVLQVGFSLEVPAGKEVTLVHLHGSTETLDKAADLVGGGAKGSKLLAGIPPEIRKTLANALTRSGSLPDDLEVLRGEGGLDVVEVRNGDQLRGTLVDETYAIKTAYGRVQLPAERVVGLLSVGRLRPLQLLVTQEGEVFGGELESDAVPIRLSSGQIVRVPVSQVARVGYRLRPGDEDETPPLTKPQVVLRTGERMVIQPPGTTLEVATRYGVLQFPVSAVSDVQLRSEDSPVHVVTLVDGSLLSGLLTASRFEFMLDGAAGAQPLTVPASAILRLKPSATSTAEPVESADPELQVIGGDVLRGQLTGVLQLDTAFEAVEVRGEQVRAIARSEEGKELRLTLWDQTVMTGELRTPVLKVRLGSGVELDVAVDLIVTYQNASPRPSDLMADRIRSLVADLNHDDFRRREQAQQEILAAGPAVIGVLEELKPAQPPEAQQRIEQILTQLRK
jgi:hypothetical protein